jgi:methylated-DNA-protein-cysteine methyltransferase-like protein
MLPGKTSKTFNEKVYKIVRLIPAGKVLSYGRVAELIEVPNGARAVGWALAALSDDGDVPWHRVINAQREISMRYDPEGGERQRRKLEAEGIVFDEKGRVPKSAAWEPSIWEIRDRLGEGNS